MRTEPTGTSAGTERSWKTLIPAMLADLGYLCVICAFSIITFVLEIPDVRLSTALAAVIGAGIHIFPYLPICALVVNLAPPTGVPRYLCFAAAGALALGCWLLIDRLTGEPATDIGVLDFVTWTLLIVACGYRSTARSSVSELQQRRAASASLAAELTRARLQLLQAQIEPHFLFNTLATVRALARLDRNAAVEMIDNLSRYLSEALPQLRRDVAPLNEEFLLVEAYLRIHQIRMGERLNFTMDLPADLADQRIPTMILLTLVENALKHGVNPLVKGGSIRVTAARESASVLLKVSDSGKGLSTTEGHGTGLANIRRRLTLLYGNRAYLSFAAPEATGATAIVSLPAGGSP